jgi:5-methylcytosine-specific restriction endonuclease McrA
MPLKDPEKRRAYRKQYREEHAEEIKQRKSAYREKNIDRLKEKDRRRYEANKAKAIQQAKDYYAKHRDHLTAMRKSRHRANPEQVRNWLRSWDLRNPERRAAIRAKRRALKAGAQMGTDRNAYAAFVRMVRNAERITCYWCGVTVPKRKRHLDHIISLAQGGADDVHNLCCSCETCNLSKGAKLPEEFTGQFLLPYSASA